MNLRHVTVYGATGCVAGAVVYLGLSAAIARGGSTSVAACPVGDRAMVQPAALPGFTRMFNSTFTSESGVKAGGAGGWVAPDMSSFEAGRMVGYISDVALSGPDVRAEKERERRLRYRGRWPLVPLLGPVVRDNPGLLEFYETVQTFRSQAGASYLMGRSRATESVTPGIHHVQLPEGVTNGIAWAGVQGPKNGENEHFVVYDVREGRAVLTARFQGGARLSTSTILRLWENAYRPLGAVCPT